MPCVTASDAPRTVARVSLAELVLAGAAALVAGAVNAIAGGGSLITFPALVALGLPPVVASLTNTVALCPGYLGATLAQRRELVGQRARIVAVVPAGVAGGVVGALLLLASGPRAFDVIVPFLLVLAAAMLAFQDRLRAWLVARTHAAREGWVAAPVGLAAVYGGYFGAGLGVIVLAALAVVIGDSLTRLNALKQAVSLAVNVAAAGVFLGSGRVDWPVAGVMLVASLAGGAGGGRIASRVPVRALRAIVVGVALVVAGIYGARLAS
jgi:uncharacterized protein